MTEIDPKLSRLYREASTEVPPAAIDAAILAAARKHVEKPQRRERPWWSRWMVPASVAATLALGVSIALLVEREHPETSGEAVIREIPPRTQSPPPARVTESARTKASDSAAPGASERKEAPAAAAVPRSPAAISPVPVAPTQAPAASLPAPAQAQVPRPAEPAPSAAEAFPAGSRAKASAPKAAATKAATESNAARDSAIGGPGTAAPAAPAAGKLAPMRQQSIQRSPEAWLDEISRLRREGRDKEAAEQLAEFRKAYPAHAVPENLLE